MKNTKTEYFVVNSFLEISETERSEKINNIIRRFCILDIEKNHDIDYNIKINDSRLEHKEVYQSYYRDQTAE